MNNKILENIYKDIPICNPITMFLQDLENISTESELLVKQIDNAYNPFFDYINKFINGNRVTFFMTLCVISNNETLEKEVKFSKAGYINSLLFSLNVNDICNTNDNRLDNQKTSIDFSEHIYELLNRQIVLLKLLGQDYNRLIEKQKDKITKVSLEIETIRKDIENNKDNKKLRNYYVSKIKEKEKEKRRYERKINEIVSEYEQKINISYPDLYKSYIELKENCEGLKSWKNAIEDKEKTEVEKEKIKNYLLESVNKKGINISYDELMEDIDKPILKFANRYSKIFTDFINHTDEILDFLDNYTINIDNLGIEPEKLELYLAHQAYMACLSGNSEDKQNYIYYVADYFRKNNNRKKDASISITVNHKDKEEIITPEILYNKYKMLLLYHPEITVLDLTNFDFTNLTVNQINSIIDKYIRVIKTNWEIIPPEKLDKLFIKKNETKDNEFLEQERLRHKNRLMELYIDKKELYGSSSHIFAIEGKQTFDGYIGFIYNNGKVVLDKFFENYGTKELADGHAVYAMNLNDFERLSAFSKSVLQKDPNVIRIIHYGNWEDRVRQIINENATKISPEEEIKRLLKNKNITQKR